MTSKNFGVPSSEEQKDWQNVDGGREAAAAAARRVADAGIIIIIITRICFPSRGSTIVVQHANLVFAKVPHRRRTMLYRRHQRRARGDDDVAMAASTWEARVAQQRNQEA